MGAPAAAAAVGRLLKPNTKLLVGLCAGLLTGCILSNVWTVVTHVGTDMGRQAGAGAVVHMYGAEGRTTVVGSTRLLSHGARRTYQRQTTRTALQQQYPVHFKHPLWWHGPMWSGSGYGAETINFLLSLSRTGRMLPEDVWAQHHGDNPRTHIKAALPAEDLKELEHMVELPKTLYRHRKGAIVVCHSVPTNWAYPEPVGVAGEPCPPPMPYHWVYLIGRTMFETDRLPELFIPRLNAMNETWVPSEWQKDVFIASGVKPEKVFVVPEGVNTTLFDPSLYKPLNLARKSQLVFGTSWPAKAQPSRRLQVTARQRSSQKANSGRKPFVFISAFKWELRKGYDVLLKAYLSEFTAEDDVELYILTKPFEGSGNAFKSKMRTWAADKLNTNDHQEGLDPNGLAEQAHRHLLADSAAQHSMDSMELRPGGMQSLGEPAASQDSSSVGVGQLWKSHAAGVAKAMKQFAVDNVATGLVGGAANQHGIQGQQQQLQQHGAQQLQHQNQRKLHGTVSDGVQQRATKQATPLQQQQGAQGGSLESAPGLQSRGGQQQQSQQDGQQQHFPQFDAAVQLASMLQQSQQNSQQQVQQFDAAAQLAGLQAGRAESAPDSQASSGQQQRSQQQQPQFDAAAQLAVKEAALDAAIEAGAPQPIIPAGPDDLAVAHYPTVYVVDSYISDAEFPRFYKAGDAFVLPTRGEGWGRPHVEAMSMGLPVISTNWSGITAYLDESVGYPLAVDRLVPVEGGDEIAWWFKGLKWAEPSVEHLRELMRRVYENRDEAAEKGAAARRRMMEEYSPEALATVVVEQLLRIETQLH